MKGKEHVLSEVNLMMMCYNLRRLMSIFNINDLKNRLKSLIPTFLVKNGSLKTFLSQYIFLISQTQFNYFINLKLIESKYGSLSSSP
jgi:hypothetical protein